MPGAHPRAPVHARRIRCGHLGEGLADAGLATFMRQVFIRPVERLGIKALGCLIVVGARR
jgi:hypothetical protein